MRRTLSDEHGQATVEHIGLVALIAAVLVVATAVAGVASPGLRNAVRGGFEHALCIVTGDTCATPTEACPTLRTVKTTGQGVAVSIVRLGHDRTLSIERRSDGTYVMSLTEGSAGGVGISLGGKVGRRGGVNVEAEALLGGRAGRIYEASTPQEARALVERLRSQRLPGVRSVVASVTDMAGLVKADPAVRSYVLAGDSAGEVMARFGLGPLAVVGARADGQAEVGVEISPRTQELTTYATLDGRASVFFEALDELAAPVGGRGPTGAKGDDAGSAPKGSLSVKNPLAQKVEGELSHGGSVALRWGPGPKLLGVEAIAYYGVGDTQREMRARLDASDPRVQEAVARWQADPTSTQALGDLARAGRDGAALDARTFEVDRSEHQHGGQVSVGHALGLEFGSESTVSRLVEQYSRPAGGEWERRGDCVGPQRA